MNFWKTLPKPIIALAPLDDVTDASFRRIIAKHSAHTRRDGSTGGPDVMFTEFVSADGIARAPEEGQKKLRADLIHTDSEQAVVAQLFTAIPEHMEIAARLCKELGFAGVDINMGCPSKTVEKQGCGSALMKDTGRAVELIAAAKQGAAGLPVSVKTRLGYNTDDVETLVPALLKGKPAALTLHARTRKEMSKVPARWERVARAVEIRDALGSDTRIIGNGDVLDVADAHERVQTHGVDGVMLGRAVFGNPWLFAKGAEVLCRCGKEHPVRALGDENCIAPCDVCGGAYIEPMCRVRVMLEHTELFEKLLPHKNFALMKKHYKAYVNGFDRAKELRALLMKAETAEEVRNCVQRFTQERGLTL